MVNIGDIVSMNGYGEYPVVSFISHGYIGIMRNDGVYYAYHDSIRLVRKKEEQINISIEKKNDEAIKIMHEILDCNFLQAEKYYRLKLADKIPDELFRNEIKLFIIKWVTDKIKFGETSIKCLTDNEQAAAIGSVFCDVQVIARAGSGKTSTIVNRAFFLQKHCRVAPGEMMLLAFNKKAANEMDERLKKLLNSKIPHTMTFHSLAYAIVHPEESILYDDPPENQLSLSLAFQGIIDDHLRIPSFENRIRVVMMTHFQEDWEQIVEGGHNLSRDEMLQFRRSLPRESLGGDAVKSFGEKVIVDFLFEHDFKYIYERAYVVGDFNMHPDFTVFADGKSGVIIEYFGLQGDPDYDKLLEKKRDYWERQEKWHFLEYSPADIASGGIEEFRRRLEIDLESCGIKGRKLTEDEIWQRLKKRSVDRFTTAVKNFIQKCRKYWLEPDQLAETIKNYQPLTQSEGLFLSLALHFYRCYVERIAATGEDDFDGLMQQAAQRIDSGYTRFSKRAGSGDLRDLRYIFIDEFQDFSEHFWRLTDAIRKQNPKVTFFCVGDDWQAINGFAGSDLKFFANFTQHFANPSQKYISTNYRSARKIVSVGNALMDGLGKPAQAHRKEEGEVLCADIATFAHTVPERNRHNADKITPAVVRLVNDALTIGYSVVLLARTNRLPYYIFDANQEKSTNDQLEDFLKSVRSYFPEEFQKRITISTAHKYKGLEKQAVIILDALERSYPLIHPDWFFSRILGDDPKKIADEERRLFYVALTRAADKLIIITDSEMMSPFLVELDRKLHLKRIKWTDCPPPPALGETGVVVVKVMSQQSRGSNPSYSIKDLLRASGYTWESQGKAWGKGFPAVDFDMETVKRELWVNHADGIEVSLSDETQTILKRYLVDGGEWREYE